MLILEDIDLIAEERTHAGGGRHVCCSSCSTRWTGCEEDADVVFLLTTNRADLLEPAPGARPGRVDLSVELPLPDADGRRRLFTLYGRRLDVSGVDLSSYVDRCAGASPAYIRELLRQAALRAAEAGRGSRVEPSDLDGAFGDLAAGGDLAQRLLGGVAPARAHPVTRTSARRCGDRLPRRIRPRLAVSHTAGR